MRQNPVRLPSSMSVYLNPYSDPVTDIERILRIDPTDELAHLELADLNKRRRTKQSCNWPGDSLRSGQGASENEHDAALDLPEESDSEDEFHTGCGKPCRYYNRLGCGYKQMYAYCHAPDSKSARWAVRALQLPRLSTLR